MGEDGDAAGVPVGHTPYSWVSQGATVPVGHTPFSWTGSTARKPPGPDPFSEIEEQGFHGYEKGQRVRAVSRIVQRMACKRAARFPHK